MKRNNPICEIEEPLIVSPVRIDYSKLSKETLEAMKELDDISAGKKVGTSYSSLEEMWSDICGKE